MLYIDITKQKHNYFSKITIFFYKLLINNNLTIKQNITTFLIKIPYFNNKIKQYINK
jgi:hypothetical protein